MMNTATLDELNPLQMESYLYNEKIRVQLQQKLDALLQTNPVDAIELSIATHLSKASPTQANIWFNLDPRDIKKIYRDITQMFTLPYNDTLNGHFIYLKLKQ